MSKQASGGNARAEALDPETRRKIAKAAASARWGKKAGDEAEDLSGPAPEFEWDREKYPVREAWEIALQRVARARKYAAMFPQFIRQTDLKFQDLDWQYENEGLKAVRPVSTHIER